jgi:hypothetical protein
MTSSYKNVGRIILAFYKISYDKKPKLQILFKKKNYFDLI